MKMVGEREKGTFTDFEYKLNHFVHFYQHSKSKSRTYHFQYVNSRIKFLENTHTLTLIRTNEFKLHIY